MTENGGGDKSYIEPSNCCRRSGRLAKSPGTFRGERRGAGVRCRGKKTRKAIGERKDLISTQDMGESGRFPDFT